MEYRQLGKSGLKVPVLNFGTATFGGTGEFFKAWGNTDAAGARRLVDICMEAGVHFFDSADGYSQGLSEEILGQALVGKRNQCLISTKATFPTGSGPNDFGSSRFHLIESCEASLKRLKTDHIDLYFMHGFDALTPVEETLRALDDLVQSGKIRYIGCSNFSGWHLMKSLSVSEKNSWSRYVAHQAYYSLIGREYEWELMPLAQDQGVGTVVWSPLAGGLLSGKVRRGQKAAANTRAGTIDFIPYNEEKLFSTVEALDQVAKETGKSVVQVALNWVLHRPTISSVVIGARNEEQLRHNLGALGWSLSSEQIAVLDKASHQATIYPYWHQNWFPQLIPSLIPSRD